MNTTTTAPLVPFHHQMADIQLRRWNAALFAARKRATDRHLASRQVVKDAERALDEAKLQLRKRQQQRRQNATTSDDDDDDDEELEPERDTNDIVSSEAAVNKARRSRDAAFQATKQAKMTQLRAAKMIGEFTKQFPQYQAVVISKRKRDDNDEEATRPSKRVDARTTTLPPPQQLKKAKSQDPLEEKIDDWRQAVTTVFADRSAMTTFPQPPVLPCIDRRCAAQDKSRRALKACPCNVWSAFNTTETKELKKERLEWHPDRFEQCGKVGVEERRPWQRMATEVFTAISDMLSYDQLHFK